MFPESWICKNVCQLRQFTCRVSTPSSGSILGEVFVSTQWEMHITDPYYAIINFGLLDMVPRVRDSQECLLFMVIYLSGINSFKGISSEWGFCIEPTRNASRIPTLWNHWLLVGQRVKVLQKVLRFMDPNENIEAYKNLLFERQHSQKDLL